MVSRRGFFLLLAALDLCLFVALIWRINHPISSPAVSVSEITLSFSFVGLGIAAFGWLWLGLRCPACKKGFSGTVLRYASVATWFTALLTLTRCPHCGSIGGR